MGSELLLTGRGKAILAQLPIQSLCVLLSHTHTHTHTKTESNLIINDQIFTYTISVTQNILNNQVFSLHGLLEYSFLIGQ